jgi:hypothetical protein
MTSSPVALVRIAVLSASALPPFFLVKASRMPPRSSTTDALGVSSVDPSSTAMICSGS